MRRSVLIYFFIFFLGVSLIGGSVLTTYSQFIEEGPLEQPKEVIVERGKDLKTIASFLKSEGVIESPSIFVLGVRASGNATKIKAGEYSFPARSSAKMAMDILVSGQTYIRRFVVPEGLTSAQIVALMDEYRGLTGSVLFVPKNGTLLPDTYYYSYGDTKKSLLTRMENAMERTLKELWEGRDTNVSLSSPAQAVVMASIVEKETSLDSERGRIASVFFNRLAKNIRLQSDPTVIYAVTDGRLDLKRPLTYNDLKIQHPYNTYVIYGLPEGAISNPGRASLEAVLNPVQTNDVYFVADGRGGHFFSQTYAEHQENVRKWRAIRKGRKEAAPPAAPSGVVPPPHEKPEAVKMMESPADLVADALEEAGVEVLPAP